MKDLIIIGAGPIGLACGIEAKKNNLDYEIIDKGMLVNSIFNYPVNTTFFVFIKPLVVSIPSTLSPFLLIPFTSQF